MRFFEPTAAQERVWKKWVSRLPKKLRPMMARFNPWTLYRMKGTGHRVIFYSVANDGTLTVIISGRFNLVTFERQVFGIKPEELEECDLPGPDEPLGSAMTQEEASENLDALRVLVRPDLWVLDESGKAIRKQ